MKVTTLVLVGACIVSWVLANTRTEVVAQPKPVQTVTITNVVDVKVPVKSYDLNDRVVYILGIIDESNSSSIAAEILRMSNDPKPITIVINSPGGSVLDGAQIISAIEGARGPVNTLCIELCASMAAMIHQYGTNRLMLDRSIIMFHPASGGAQGEVDKMASRINTIKDYIGEMEQNVAKRSKMTYNEYKFKSGTELWLSAKDAYKSNVSDSTVVIRGSQIYKVYRQMPGLFGKTTAPLPFSIQGDQVVSLNGKFYWVSVPAVRMLGGYGL